MTPSQTLPDWSLYLVTDAGLAGPRGVLDTVRAAVRGGVTVVQLREKTLAARDMVRHSCELRSLLDPLCIPLIVNDRFDVALACGAGGVHLGQEDLPCEAVRKAARPGFLIGVSVSTTVEAIRAERAGADYLGVSPVYGTPTKPEAPPPVGLDGLLELRRATRLPLVAIGGMNAGTAAEAVRAGADGIAVVSALMAARDPEAAARELRSVIEAARGETS